MGKGQVTHLSAVRWDYGLIEIKRKMDLVGSAKTEQPSQVLMIKLDWSTGTGGEVMCAAALEAIQ